MKLSIVGGEKWKRFFTLNSEYSCLIPRQQRESFGKIEILEWIQTKHCNVPVLPLKAQYMGTILEMFFFFSGMVALLLFWQLLFNHLRKSQGPNTSSPRFPGLLLQRLWSDSISNVLPLHKHSWEQCTSLDLQSSNSVSCQNPGPIILSRRLLSAVYWFSFKNSCFTNLNMCVSLEDKARLSFMRLCADLARSRLICRALAAHLLCVCQAQGGRSSAFCWRLQIWWGDY